METSAHGRAFIERYEGLILHTYNDGVGVPTIGYGHTTAAGGPSVAYGQKITAGEADQLLAHDLGVVEHQVLSAVHVPLNQGEFDMLVSFTFNCGPGGLQKLLASSGLNAGHYNAIPASMMHHVYGRGGVHMDGLVRRRKEEGALWAAALKQPMPLRNPVPPEPVSKPMVRVAPALVPEAHTDGSSLHGLLGEALEGLGLIKKVQS